MKTRMLRWLARVALSLVAIAAWGTGASAQSLSGVYGGEKCPYKLTFRGKDVVYMQIIGIAEVPGQYKVDGDKVPVTAGIYSTVFTRNGDALVGLFEGQTVVCTNLARTPIPSSCDHFAYDYNRGNICFDTRPLLLTPTSKAKGGNGWSPDQRQGAVVLPAPADASIMPNPVLLAIRVSRDGRTLEAGPWKGGNVKTFNDAAVDMAKSLRWKPAQRYGEAVEAWVPLEFQAVIAGPSGFISVNVTGGDELGNSVYIDRVLVGNPPPVINYQVRAGRHTIYAMIKGPPYREVNETVQVASGATVVKSYGATPQEAAEPAGSVVEVKMTGDGTTKAAFEPATLTVKGGTTVRFINVSGGPHNIAFFADSIPKGGAEALKNGMANAMGDLTGPFLVQPNEKYDVSFAGAPAGTYKIYCMPHVALGMKITVKVQ